MNQNKKDKGILLFGGMLIMLTQFSISSNCFSLFVIPICRDLDFMRGQFSIAQSMLSLGGVCASALSGSVFNRFGILRVMRISVIVTAIVYLLQSFASTVPAFCIINFFIGFFNCFGTFVPISLLISDWFLENKNTANGIAMMGSGIGTSIFTSLGNSLILDLGWRLAMRILAGIMGLVSCLAVFTMLKETNSEKEEPAAPENRSSATMQKSSFLGGKNTVIAFMCAAISVASGVLINTAQPHLQDIGYSQTYAAHLFSAGMFVMALGKILHGMIIDRFGVRISNTAIVFTASLGLIGLLHYSGTISAVLVCIGMLFITSLNVVGSPALAETLGGQENKKFYLGMLSAFINGGYMLAPFIYGVIYDRTRSYRPMYYVAIGLLLLSLLGIWGLLPAKKRKE